MVNEGFCPQGAKNTTPEKVKGLKTAAIQGEMRRIRFGTSVASAAFMKFFYSAHRIYFAAFREAHAAPTSPGVLIFS
jgi:hypothetical protein